MALLWARREGVRMKLVLSILAVLVVCGVSVQRAEATLLAVDSVIALSGGPQTVEQFDLSGNKIGSISTSSAGLTFNGLLHSVRATADRIYVGGQGTGGDVVTVFDFSGNVLAQIPYLTQNFAVLGDGSVLFRSGTTLALDGSVLGQFTSPVSGAAGSIDFSEESGLAFIGGTATSGGFTASGIYGVDSSGTIQRNFTFPATGFDVNILFDNFEGLLYGVRTFEIQVMDEIGIILGTIATNIQIGTFNMEIRRGTADDFWISGRKCNNTQCGAGQEMIWHVDGNGNIVPGAIPFSRFDVLRIPVPVPEPAAIYVFAFGLAGLGFMTRRRRRTANRSA